MEIPNLSATEQTNLSTAGEAQSPCLPTGTATERKFPVLTTIIVLSAIFIGFWLSRFFPSNQSDSSIINPKSGEKEQIISAENLKKAEDVKVGTAYGDIQNSFKDSAIGTIIKGSINGVGTHILEREGGQSQRASLTSSILDLDLFIDHKVEIKGETNASDKTSWLLDVGSVKVLE
ncbi:hypothetical protein KKE45_00655 [Patescibacteria group bacterium]|nr:hypothetical protein [Patescibacteria group bacterium]